jgi:hypothetical protein
MHLRIYPGLIITSFKLTGLQTSSWKILPPTAAKTMMCCTMLTVATVTAAIAFASASSSSSSSSSSSVYAHAPAKRAPVSL